MESYHKKLKSVVYIPGSWVVSPDSERTFLISLKVWQLILNLFYVNTLAADKVLITCIYKQVHIFITLNLSYEIFQLSFTPVRIKRLRPVCESRHRRRW